MSGITTTHAELRATLAALDDAALLARCILDIRESRRYRSDRRLQLFRDLCWQECLRRERKDLFTDAIREVQRQEEELRERNRLAGKPSSS